MAATVTRTRGNLLDDDAHVLVNTVNTVGVMGAGIALAFKRRFPVMFRQYRQQCASRAMRVGVVGPWAFIDHQTGQQRFVLNLPTKADWRNPSEYAYVRDGLAALTNWLHTQRIDSIAMPPLGCGLGGLDWRVVEQMILDEARTWPDGIELRLYVP